MSCCSVDHLDMQHLTLKLREHVLLAKTSVKKRVSGHAAHFKLRQAGLRMVVGFIWFYLVEIPSCGDTSSAVYTPKQTMVNTDQ